MMLFSLSHWSSDINLQAIFHTLGKYETLHYIRRCSSSLSCHCFANEMSDQNYRRRWHSTYRKQYSTYRSLARPVRITFPNLKFSINRKLKITTETSLDLSSQAVALLERAVSASVIQPYSENVDIIADMYTIQRTWGALASATVSDLAKPSLITAVLFGCMYSHRHQKYG